MEDRDKARVAAVTELTDAIRAFHAKPVAPAFVMSLAHYKRLRRDFGGDMTNPDTWEPDPHDLIMGYQVIVEEADNEELQQPHLEIRHLLQRPPQMAGQTYLKEDKPPWDIR